MDIESGGGVLAFKSIFGIVIYGLESIYKLHCI